MSAIGTSVSSTGFEARASYTVPLSALGSGADETPFVWEVIPLSAEME